MLRMSFELTSEQKENKLLIKLHGRIGGEASITMYQDIKALTESYKRLDFVLDFKDVDFIDSSGLGSLVAINSTLLKHGRELYLASIQNNLKGLLKITNLDKILKMVDTAEDAF